MRTKSLSKSRVEANLKAALSVAGTETLFFTTIKAEPKGKNTGVFNISVNAAKGVSGLQLARSFRKFLRETVAAKVGNVSVEPSAHDSGRNLEQICVHDVQITERRLANYDPA